MKLLLTGATGFIGRHVATALAAAGHHAKPISRRHGIDFGRLLAPADWTPHLVGVDAVINCVGIIGEHGRQRFEPLHHRAPAALFRASADAGVRRIVQISALGADETAFSAYHLSKRAADDYLRTLDLDWFVLRPSLVYGPGGKSAALFMRLAALPVIPVLEDGLQILQPVHVSDLVATVLRCLDAGETRRTLDVVGPETLAFAEWLQRMREAQGLPRGRLCPIPFPWAMAAARLGRYINPLLQSENLRMLKIGYRADVEPLARFLGRRPLTPEADLFLSDTARAAPAARQS